MHKILYVVSTLERSGPTNQLFNLVSCLDMSRWSVSILTLSPEPENTRWDEFIRLGLSVSSLGLSRLEGMLLGKSKLRNFVGRLNPDLIHSQGIRADALIGGSGLPFPWVSTARNFAPEDYPGKFGSFKGGLMAKKHLAVHKRCPNLVACSKTINKKLSEEGVNSIPIQNGVRFPDVEFAKPDDMSELPRPVYVSVGSLIPRKNMQLLVHAFHSIAPAERGCLVILGDGPEKQTLQDEAGDNVLLMGNVDNVLNHLAFADVFVSGSLSEGLPNTVLEALSVGLPVVLSDIDSHKEIVREVPEAATLFPLANGEGALAESMAAVSGDLGSYAPEAIRASAAESFSAERMSAQYQDLYLGILEAK